MVKYSLIHGETLKPCDMLRSLRKSINDFKRRSIISTGNSNGVAELHSGTTECLFLGASHFML